MVGGRLDVLDAPCIHLAEVIDVDVSVQVPAGTFTGCIKTRDLSVIERDYQGIKTYCPGVGVVLEEEEDERVELIEYSIPEL